MRSFSSTIRALHRDLGYFVIGLTLIYAITGIILSGRGLAWFTQEFKDELVMQKAINKKDFNSSFVNEILKGNVSEIFDEDSYEIIKKRLHLKLVKEEQNIFHYKAWKSLKVKYNSSSGKTLVSYKGYPLAVEIFVDAHKASHESAWFYLAIIYSLILSFLAISSFWMMKGKNGFKRRGVYFMLAGFLVVGIFLALG